MGSKIISYVLPLLTLVFLFVFLVISGPKGIVGLASYEPQITGYVQINSLGKMPEECIALLKFYNNSYEVKKVIISYDEIIEKSKIEKTSLEEIYYIDLVKLIPPKTEVDEVFIEILCNNKIVSENRTKL